MVSSSRNIRTARLTLCTRTTSARRACSPYWTILSAIRWTTFHSASRLAAAPAPLPNLPAKAHGGVHRAFNGKRPNPQAAGTAALIGVGGAAADAIPSIPSVQGGVSSTVMGVTVSSDGTTSATNTVIGVSADLTVVRQGAS